MRARPRRRQSHHPPLLFVRARLLKHAPRGDRRQRRAHRAGDRPCVPICSARPYGSHCKRSRRVLAGARHQARSAGTSIRRTGGCATRPRSRPTSSRTCDTCRARNILLMHDIQARDGRWRCRTSSTGSTRRTRRASAAGEPPIKIIDYAICCREHKLVPPLLDALGRVLIDLASSRAAAGAGPALAATCLALGPGVVSPFSRASMFILREVFPDDLEGLHAVAHAPRHGQPARRPRGPREADRSLAEVVHRPARRLQARVPVRARRRRRRRRSSAPR